MKIKAFYSIPVGDHCYITSFVCPDRSQMDVFVFFKTADVMEGFFLCVAGRMGLKRSATCVWRIRKPCRRQLINGAWRTCKGTRPSCRWNCKRTHLNKKMTQMFHLIFPNLIHYRKLYTEVMDHCGFILINVQKKKNTFVCFNKLDFFVNVPSRVFILPLRFGC